MPQEGRSLTHNDAYTPVSNLDETGRPTTWQVLFNPLHGRSSSAAEVAMQCSGSGMAQRRFWMPAT